MLDLVGAGRPVAKVTATWLAAPELRAIYRCRDRDQAAARLYDWTVTCIDSHVPELRRLARTLTTWRAEFLAYFSTGRISNGPTEAVNLLIKKILRVAHGFRNFHNYRLRLLLHCGITWQHHTPTPLRGRLPAWLRRAGYRDQVDGRIHHQRMRRKPRLRPARRKMPSISGARCDGNCTR